MQNPPFAIRDRRQEQLDTFWVSTFDLTSILSFDQGEGRVIKAESS